MNMVSIGIPLFIITVSYITANKGFLTVRCKTENKGCYGQKSLLECVVRPTQYVADTQIQVVTWKKVGVEEPLVVFHRGDTKQVSGYSFAEPSWNNKNMNVSLLITNTALHDEGDYTCVVMTNSGSAAIHTSLKITASFDPDPHDRYTFSHTGFLTMRCKTENMGCYGQKSLLECVVRPTQYVADTQIQVVTWKKVGVEEPLVVFHRGDTKQVSGYSLAELSWNNKNMNVSLLITNTALHDEGDYTCVVMTNSGSAAIHTSLKITASFDPDPHDQYTFSHTDSLYYDINYPVIVIAVISTLTAVPLIVLGVILWARNRDKTTSVQQISKDNLSKDMTKNDLDSVGAPGRSIQSLYNF